MRIQWTGKTSPGIAANTLVFSVVATAGFHTKIKKLVFGFEGALTPSTVSLGLFRCSAAGTGAVAAGSSVGTDGGSPNSITTVYTSWSVQPTLAANPLIKRSFNVMTESEWLLEVPDELDATSTGAALSVLDNALPPVVSLVWYLETEE